MSARLLAAAAGVSSLLLAFAGCGGPSGPLRVHDRGHAHLGSFDIELGDELIIRHDGRDEPLFESIPGQPFLSARAAEDEVESYAGSFVFREVPTYACSRQIIDRFDATSGSIVISGRLRGDACRADFVLTFTTDGSATLLVDASVDGDDLDRISLIGQGQPDDQIFGFGTQYSHVDVAGRVVPVWVREQGIGRGLEPLTSVVNLGAPGSGGDWYTTYAPVPFFVTSSLRALALDSSEYAEFDFSDPETVRIEQWSTHLQARLYAATSPVDAIRLHTESAGRMKALPAWAGDGAVIRVHGGSDAVRATVEELENAGVPLAAVWIEDWVGERTALGGTRLWWNWEVDADLYPDWPQLVSDLSADGVRVMIYFNPYLADASEKANASRNLFAEARDAGYLVRTSEGDPYLIDQGGFDAAIVDLSNAEAVAWYQQLITAQLDVGVAGWMADFGEALPYDAVIANGDARSFHNQYPVAWARLNDEAIAAAGRDDVIAFHRSGYTTSPQYADLFWLGDQTVTWDEFDGIKTVVRGLISSGISGFALEHADIGGYLSVKVGAIDLTRSTELLERWIELAAFTALFRTHETNRRDDNVQVDSSPELLAHFARFARIFAALGPYRRRLMAVAESDGTPLVRHTWLVAPDEPDAGRADQQFFLGDDLLVAPVLDEGATEVEVYLPAGTWTRVGGDDVTSSGEWKTVSAPVGDPAVFYREGFQDAAALESAWAS